MSTQLVEGACTASVHICLCEYFMLPPRISALDRQTSAQHRCCTAQMFLGLDKKNLTLKKKGSLNFQTLLTVLIGFLSLLTHGMRQTAFCSQACNTGRFGQDLLKPIFITCLTSFSSALRLHGFLYLFFCIYQPWVLRAHSLRRSHSLPVKWVATSAHCISYRGKPS